MPNVSEEVSEWSRVSKKSNDVTKSQAKLGLQAKHVLRDRRQAARANHRTMSQPAYKYNIAQYVYILNSSRYIDNTVYRNNEYIITNNNYKANLIAGKCQIKKKDIQVTWLRNILSSQYTVRIVKSQETPKGQINVTFLRPHSMAGIAGIKRHETSTLQYVFHRI